MYSARLTSELATYASVSTRGVVEFNYSKLALTLWLSYTMTTSNSLWWESAHESTYSPYQYTTMDPLPSSYRNAIHSTHAYIAHFRVSTFTCLWTVIGNPEVLYRGHAYSNRSFITLQGCTSSHTLSPLTTMYTSCISATFKRKPGEGVGHGLPKHSSL